MTGDASGGESKASEMLGEDKSESADGWTVSNRLKAASILATFLVSVLGLVISLASHKASTADRVEMNHTITNSNGDDFANAWMPWEQPITPHTMFLGVQRKVLFAEPFSTVPNVSTALSLIDLKQAEQVLIDLGYHRADHNSGLQDFHVVTLPTSITKKGFTLQIGIGIQTTPGKFLAAKLQETQVESTFLAEMMRYNQLSDRSELKTTRDEQWMVNFYLYVGSVEVSWIAQAHQK